MTERDNFLEQYDVPRGTAVLFDQYAALLIEWQAKMNLVAPSTINHLWTRHFADSAQLIGHGPPRSNKWVDIGAGAGFPGIVIAMLSDHEVTLIESTGKKCRFLETVIEQVGIANATVCQTRAEAVFDHTYDVVSARACAPLLRLFDIGAELASDQTIWVLPKGASVDRELDDARRAFDFRSEQVPSLTDSRGRIVIARDVRRKVHRH